MKKYQQLHELIHSLNRAEKRHFKVQAQLHTRKGKNNYLILFEAVESQPRADEPALDDLFRDTTLYDSLPTVKNQLYNLILKLCLQLHQKYSPRMKAQAYLDEAELLSQKGLFSAARKRLVTGRKLAEKHGFYDLAHNCSLWLSMRYILDKETAADIETHEVVSQTLMRKTLLLQSWWSEIMLANSSSKIVPNSEAWNRMHEIKKEIQTIHSEPPTTFEAKRCYHLILGYHSLTVEYDVEEAASHFQKGIENWQNNPIQKSIAPLNYTSDLVLVYSSAIRLRRREEAVQILEDIEQVDFGRFGPSLKFKTQLFTYQLYFYVNHLQYNQALPTIKSIEKWLKEVKEEIDTISKLSFYYNLAMFYFNHGYLSQANTFILKILQDPALPPKNRWTDSCRILQIIIYYDAEEYDLVESLIRSTSRNMKRHNTMMEFERMLLSLIRRGIRKAHPKEMIPAFQQTLDKFNELHENPNGKLPAGFFETSFWLESKVKRIPIGDLMAEKLAENPDDEH